MLNLEAMVLRIKSDNEQDRAAAEQWWKEASNESKLAVWFKIQEPHKDPIMEIMTRFAQLAFSEMLEKFPPKKA